MRLQNFKYLWLCLRLFFLQKWKETLKIWFLFIHFGFNTPRLAAHQVIPVKAGIQKKTNWMPDQVRHDEMPSIPRTLAAE
jgi:hypothetical protein